MRILAQLADDLATFRTTSRTVVEECLARIQDPAGEGVRAFLKVHSESARQAADHFDELRRKGAPLPSPFAGIPVSIKDLFDIAGDVTTAGSKILRTAPPAQEDAVSVARLRAAGFIPIGRTNMTEFAFSGLGLNAHYGTPLNPHDRRTGRIPGGSSSGAAVSVTDGMAVAALGTDTGGSCRIPAALCGIAGFKPTQKRVPLKGAFPLSSTLDSIGPLGASVQCCAIMDAVLAGETDFDLAAVDLSDLHFAVPQTLVLDGMDATVARSFEHVLHAITTAGAKITEIPLQELGELAEINRKGGFSPPEAYSLHREWIAASSDAYDRRVLVRIMRGKEQDEADYAALKRARTSFIERVAVATARFDAMLMPTVPVIAPPISELESSDEIYTRTNMLMLRNPSIVNFLDGCAISIPCHDPGDLPTGLMLAGASGTDRRLLAIAAAIESLTTPTALLAG
jgi:aspartyl-tRNA(Asn)/glutamyl-tRNA(Gln) amidotransferase subunit A